MEEEIEGGNAEWLVGIEPNGGRAVLRPVCCWGSF